MISKEMAQQLVALANAVADESQDFQARSASLEMIRLIVKPSTPPEVKKAIRDAFEFLDRFPAQTVLLTRQDVMVRLRQFARE